jgi:Fructosamine-3-kinase
MDKMELNSEWFDELKLNDVRNYEPVSGGDLNLAFEITTPNKRYFLKVQPNNDGSFYDHEIAGLKLMQQAVNAPQVISSGTFKNNGYLLMQYVDFGSGNQYDLGKMVAKLHEVHNDKFGLDHSVINAKNPKINNWQSNWGDFFVNQRLEVLAQKVRDKGLWNDYRQNLLTELETLILETYRELPVVPSLLHGDLWSGNVGFTSKGEPILFDPDVFYGDREMDLAMTLLFGGFSQEFYNGYESEYPLDKNWQKRIPWYQSYYLLAHLNLFGESYGASLENALENGLDYK